MFGLPVGISFFGRAYSEPILLKLAYAFEQATRAPSAGFPADRGVMFHGLPACACCPEIRVRCERLSSPSGHYDIGGGREGMTGYARPFRPSPAP